MHAELLQHIGELADFTVKILVAENSSVDIGLVGKSVGKYTMFLGGNPEGTRLCFIYKDSVPAEEIVTVLTPLLAAYKSGRQGTESFGDFCARKGQAELETFAA